MNKLIQVAQSQELDWMARSKQEVGGIVDVPEGVSGDWKLKYVELDEGMSMRTMFAHKERMVPPGRYAQLVEGSQIYMSDTPAEMLDHVDLVTTMHKLRTPTDVLVFGLGIGLVMELLADMPVPPASVTFVEKSQDVIDLVAPHYLKKYPGIFKVVHADALTVTAEDIFKQTGKRHWDAIWADIWPSICMDDADEHQHFLDMWTDFGDWVHCWQEDEVMMSEDAWVERYWNE